jgi:hypothetical protein
MNDLKKGEKLKDVPGYKGVYAVSSQGRIWSLKRKIWLSPFNTGNGYQTVRLSHRGDESDKKIHRLVGEAFIPNPDNKPQINHKNGIKSDCRACNLEWVTARENMQHACDTGLNSTFRFSFKDKLLICKMYILLKVKKAHLARLFDVSPPAISYIIKNYSSLA